MQQENSEPVLYQGKAFTTWKQAFETIESWAKQQGFNIIYSHIEKKSDRTFHRHTAQCEYHATNNVYPQIIMTDAVHAAIRSIFSTTYSQNLIKKVQKLLENKLQEFFTKFYAVRNTPNTLSFESEWRKLITQYPKIQQYLTNTFYNTKELWVHPWTCQQFTAGLHASSPVESINAWIKSYIFNSNISLCELGDVIERRQCYRKLLFPVYLLRFPLH
ncbi:hypothetical protein C1646_773107 [Rhizophagus diaphanus]|nr:hypothetical protein C1646_773107 [Rhizophagus diaphanus] [Rhizophagus sp. MUCL 43196]